MIGVVLSMISAIFLYFTWKHILDFMYQNYLESGQTFEMFMNNEDNLLVMSLALILKCVLRPELALMRWSILGSLKVRTRISTNLARIRSWRMKKSPLGRSTGGVRRSCFSGYENVHAPSAAIA